MHVLVVDTATAAVSAALVRVSSPAGGQAPQVTLLAQHRVVDARAHGERLAPAVAKVLADAGPSADPGPLRAVVAGVGPGPFTGLRVGLATAAAMGHALGIPTYGVCSLDGLGVLTHGAALVATDARRKEVYWAVYRDGVRVGGPAVHRPADVATALADILPGVAPAAAVGDGALLYQSELASTLAVTVLDSPRYPDAVALASLAAERILVGAPAEVLTPLYLRRADAVEPAAPKRVLA